MLVSLCDVWLRWLLEFVALRARSKVFKDLDIIVLRHELAIRRRTTRSPAITTVDRVLLAVASRRRSSEAEVRAHPDREGDGGTA